MVSLAVNVPGPIATARLASEGARVAKIEPPSGDPLERYCPEWYEELHRGVDVQRLDLKTGEGAARLRRLLHGADLLVASSRPSSLARLGLDDHRLRGPAFPRLRWLNIVGESNRPEVPGHDATYVARAGLMGHELPRTLLADVLGAERAFAAALLLLRREPGASATIGLYDSLAPLVAPLRYGVTRPGGILGGGLPYYRLYEAREGRVVVATLEAHFRERLYAELAVRLDADLADVMRTRTAAEWETWAAERNLPVCAVGDP